MAKRKLKNTCGSTWTRLKVGSHWPATWQLKPCPKDDEIYEIRRDGEEWVSHKYMRGKKGGPIFMDVTPPLARYRSLGRAKMEVARKRKKGVIHRRFSTPDKPLVRGRQQKP